MSFIEQLINLKNEDDINRNVIKFINKPGKTQNAIRKREHFFLFRELLIPYYYEFIHILNKMENANLLSYFIRGSSAWFNNAVRTKSRNYKNIASLLNKEVGDVIYPAMLAQNWDFSIFVEKDNLLKVTNILSKFVSDLVKTIRKDMINAKQVSEKKMDNKIEQFKGYYIALCIEHESFREFADFADFACRSQSHHSFFAFWATLHPVNNLETFKKDFIIPLSIKLPASVIAGPDHEKARFLNEKGLLMYSIFMYSEGLNRTLDKGINIDKLRMLWFTKNWQDLAKIYLELYDIWQKVDKDEPFFENKWQYDNIKDSLQQNILKSIFIEDEGVDNLDLLDKRLIEFYRGIMNIIVIDLNRSIQKYKSPIIERIDVMIVGGDAFTRYISSSKTADIDVKVLVIPKKETKERWFPNKEYFNIQDIISEVLSKYIVYLNYIKKFSPIYNQFRLREWDDVYPGRRADKFHLFSIDCRTIHKTRVNLGGNIYDLKNFKHDLAILDVAITYDYDRSYADIETINYMDVFPTSYMQCQYIKYPVNILDYKIPVSSAKYLMKELATRFDNDGQIFQRFESGKIMKDISRYRDLKAGNNLIVKNNIVDLYLISTILDENSDNKLLFDYAAQYNYLYNIIKFGKKSEYAKKQESFNISANERIIYKDMPLKYKIPYGISSSGLCNNKIDVCNLLNRKMGEDNRFKLVKCNSYEFRELFVASDIRCIQISPELFNRDGKWGAECE